MLEHVTGFNNGGRIDRHVSLVNVPDDAFFIDQEGGAISKALLFIKNTIIPNYSAFEIAQQRKRDFELFREFAVGGNTVYTHAENLSVG